MKIDDTDDEDIFVKAARRRRERRKNESVFNFDGIGFGSVRFINKLKKMVRQDAKKIRSKIVMRDDYRCQLCGTKNNIAMHHIISVDDYVAFLFSQLDKDNVNDSIPFARHFSCSVINNPTNLCHNGIINQSKFKLMNIAIQNNKKMKKQTRIIKFRGVKK